MKNSTPLNYVSMPDGQHHQNSAMILAGRACCASASAIAIPASYTYVAEIARLIIDKTKHLKWHSLKAFQSHEIAYFIDFISSSDSRGFLGCFLSVGWSFGLVLSYALGSILRWAH